MAKKQGYNSKLDESLGARKGASKTKTQSMKSRRDESKGMEKASGKRAYSAVKTMDKMEMAKPMKKASTKKAPPKKKVAIAKGVKVTRAKEKAMEKKPGGSNVGEYKSVPKKDFAGPKGGSPMGSFPINTLAKAKSALKLAHNAPNPAGIKGAVYRKFPQLKKGK